MCYILLSSLYTSLLHSPSQSYSTRAPTHDQTKTTTLSSSSSSSSSPSSSSVSPPPHDELKAVSWHKFNSILTTLKMPALERTLLARVSKYAYTRFTSAAIRHSFLHECEVLLQSHRNSPQVGHRMLYVYLFIYLSIYLFISVCY